MREGFIRILPVFAGPVLWAGLFSAVYALHAIACAVAPSQAASAGVTVAILLAGALTVAGCIFLMYRSRRTASESEVGRALGRIAFFAHLLSLIAILWTLTAASMIGPCTG